MSNKDLYTIRQVIELTGISEFTLRGWETRYKAFSPIRTNTDRRLYQKKDIQKALLLQDLLMQGHRIGKISSLDQHELELLISKKESQNTAHKEVIEVMNLISLQKWTELGIKIHKIKYKTDYELIDNFVLPIINNISNLVEKKQLSIAQEHIASSYLKEKIYYSLSTKKNQTKDEIRIICATPEKDYHELGILCAHLLIKSYGYQSLYLGPNTPQRDLVETALNYKATHILIASTISKNKGAEQEFMTYLHYVAKNTASSVKIYIAGSQSTAFQKKAAEKIYPINNFSELNDELISISKARKRK